jgi:hypothetical protein
MLTMSVLEFISSLKWPVVLLAMFFWIARALKKNPGFRDWFKHWVENHDFRGKIGPAELEAFSRESELVQAAAATDEELAELAGADRPGTEDVPTAVTTTAVAALRREVVEEVIRSAAQWGWETAHMGFRTPPNPRVEWTDDGRPVIRFGEGTGDLISRTIVVGEPHDQNAGENRTRATSLQEAIRRRLEEQERRHREGR